MSDKTIVCPETGATYPHPKRLLKNNRGLPNRYRYRGEHGDKDITAECYANHKTKKITLAEAIDFAVQLNEKFYGETVPVNALDKILADTASEGQMWLTKHVDDWLLEFEKLNPSKLTERSWPINKAKLRKFAAEFNHYKPEQITNDTLFNWFNSMNEFKYLNKSFHVQKIERTILNKFFANYVSRKNIFPNVVGNIFAANLKGGVSLAERPAKERTPFSVDEYMVILTEAIKITHEYRFHKEVRKRTKYNFDWFIWTWKFALETGLREADIIGICFDRLDCKDPKDEPKFWDREKNMLIVTIGKTKRQRKTTKPQVNKWDLTDPKNAQILILLEQALITRNEVKTNKKGFQSPAKTLVHKRPVMCKPSKEKVHYSAVTCKDVQEVVYLLRDKIPRVNALKSALQKPTFHEVRALFALTKWEAGWDLEVIAKALGHADVRVLLEHYGIHMTDNEELVGSKDDPNFRTKNRLKVV